MNTAHTISEDKAGKLRALIAGLQVGEVYAEPYNWQALPDVRALVKEAEEMFPGREFHAGPTLNGFLIKRKK